MGFDRLKFAFGTLSSALALLIGLSLGGGHLPGGLAMAQQYETDTASTAKMAASNVIQDHIHALVIRDEDIDALMAIAGDSGSIPIESSAAFNHGDANGPSHVHIVQIRKSHLQDLKDGKDVEIASETTDGHSHIFRFVTKAECPGIYLPPPSYLPVPTCLPGSSCYCQKYPGAPSCGFYCPPGSYCYCQRYPTAPICGSNCPAGSPCFCQKYPKARGCGSYTPPPVYTPPPYTPRPTPTVTPTVTPSTSPSPSPSPSVSVTPRPSPSASPSASPSPSPSVTATARPSPSATPSASPSPSASARPSASPSPTASAGSTPSPSPRTSPEPQGGSSPGCAPGSDCYCGIPGNSDDPACAANCATPGTTCYCNLDPSDPSCSGGG